MVGSHKTETVRLLYDVWHFNAVPPPFFSTVVDIVHFQFAECFPLGLKGNPAMPQHVNILFAGTFDRSAEQMAARATRIINEWLCVSLATVTKSQAAVTPLSWLSDAFSKTLVSLVREHRDTVWRKDFETAAYLGYSFFFLPSIQFAGFQNANVHTGSLCQTNCADHCLFSASSPNKCPPPLFFSPF